MRIATKLRVMSLLPIVLALLVAVVSLEAFRRVRAAHRRGRMADRAVVGVFELDILTYEYLQHRSERARRQWQLKHESLMKSLAELHYPRPEETELLSDLRAGLGEVAGVFRELTAHPEDDSISREYRTRLTGQLLVKSHDLVSLASQLAARSEARMARVQSWAGGLILTLVFGLAVVVAAASLHIGQTIIRGIGRLRRGAETLGSGDLEHRLQVESGDELGELADAFNRMAENLQAVTASRDELDREIDEHERTLRRLERSEERFRTLVANIPGAVYRCACDPDWTMQFLSNAIEDLSGYPASDFLGNPVRSYASIIHPQDRELVEQAVQNGVNSREPYAIEYRIIAADGSVRWVYEKGQGVFDEEGRVQWLDGAIFDVTDRKRTEQKLRATMAELERSNRELEQFAYVASHDLQEPLRKIRAFGDRLETRCGDALPPKGQDYLDRMVNAAERMSKLINDLLALSRVTTRGKPFIPVDLGKVTREVLSDLEARIEEVDGRVEVDGLPTIHADPTQMRQLLQNLISNALKFHREGVPPVVRVQAEVVPDPDNGEVCRLTVEDNGIGFDEQHADRIFGVFQRLHARGEYKGTGIGLAVCRKIAERHGGRITARSRPGEGATFTVTLPTTHPGDSNNGAPDNDTDGR
ncbi:MAG: ATP-binding protein [Candidatus Brocadiia bacterium]